MNVDVTKFPGPILKQLGTELGARIKRMDKLESYYRGTQAIPLNTSKGISDAYQRLMGKSSLNLPRLTVEATRERLKVLGIRTSAESGDRGDQEAWRIWQANSLDADHMLVDRATLTMGRSYVQVGAVDPEIDAPLITPEDPREVITRQNVARRRKVDAALKVFVDEWGGFDRAILWARPNPSKPEVFVYRLKRKRGETNNSKRVETLDFGSWEWDGQPQRMPFNVVPIVEFANLPGLGSEPEGEFEAHLPHIDRINYNIFSRLEVMTLQAFRQKALKGLPLKDPSTGEAIDWSNFFAVGPDELWQLPPGVDVWESELADLNQFIAVEKQDIITYAGATATPLSYLFPDSDGGSAEGAMLKRESATYKALDRMAQQGESYEQVLQLAFLFAGDPQRASRGQIEMIWAHPERFTLEAKADAAAKYAAAGVPLTTVARDVLQMTPQAIERMIADKMLDALISPRAEEADDEVGSGI